MFLILWSFTCTKEGYPESIIHKYMHGHVWDISQNACTHTRLLSSCFKKTKYIPHKHKDTQREQAISFLSCHSRRAHNLCADQGKKILFTDDVYVLDCACVPVILPRSFLTQSSLRPLPISSLCHHVNKDQV